MTHVTSAKSPIDERILKVGQGWHGSLGQSFEILALEVLPYRNATNNNTRVTYKASDEDEPKQCSFLDFITNVTGPTYEDKAPPAGLHEYHLTDPKRTIAVGQRYQHYKGNVYNIVDVSLDANVGSDNFNLARISYRSVDPSDNFTWNLSVEEFLKFVGDVPRFTLVQRTGRDKRDVQLDRSLKYYWRISA